MSTVLLRRAFIALLATFFCATAFAQLNYTISYSSSTNSVPSGVALADFNRDGKPDFAALEGSQISVYLNIGSGKFSGPVNSPVPSDAYLVQAADFNRDRKIDVVIAEANTSRLGILLGNGNGTFGAPSYLPLASYPQAVALGDINNDGKVDIAVESCTTSVPNVCSIDIYLGNGSGGFSLANVFNVPGGFSRDNLVLTDFNRDGKLDLATVATGPSRALVYFGQGNGTFKAPLTLVVKNPVPSQSYEEIPNLVSGDFNGDGVPDLAVMAGYGCGSACGQANVTSFLSNGAGGFTERAYWIVANNFGTESMLAADLNNDLRQDLMLWNGGVRSGRIDNWLGNGNGTFYDIGGPGDSFSDVQIRDMNLDGRHDLVYGDYLFDGVGVQLNSNGSGLCAPPPSDSIRAKICSPGSTTSSTSVSFLASGNSPVGVKRLELWVDGTKRYEVLNDQLKKTLTLSTGSHQITVVAVDKLVGISKTTKTITVY